MKDIKHLRSFHHSTGGEYTIGLALLIHVAFAVLKVFLILLPVVDIFFEEAQYWLWSRVPDWSYYSKPPLVAYVNLISAHLFGVSHLGIRINAVICGLLIGLVIYQLAKEMFHDNRIAFLSSIALIAFPYFWIISFFFTTDSLLTLFWVVALWLGWKVTHGGDPRIVWWLAVSVGFGILSKFTMLFFWPLFLFYAGRYHRKSIRPMILPIVFSLLFTLPVLIWNQHHNWITVRHLFQLSGGGQPLFDGMNSIRHLGEYLLGQFGLFFLFFPLVFFRANIQFFRKNEANESHHFLYMPIFFTLVLFGILSVITHVEANWTFFALPAFAVISGRALACNRENIYRKAAYTTGLMLLFFFLPMLSVPLNLPSERNPFKRLMGWRAVANQVQEVMDRDHDPGIRYHVITESYQWSSLLSFYLRDHPISYVLEYDRKMNQLDLWRSRLETGQNERYIILVKDLKQFKPLLSNQFEEARDSLEIDYPLNRRDSLKYKVIVYDKFNGFSGHGY